MTKAATNASKIKQQSHSGNGVAVYTQKNSRQEHVQFNDTRPEPQYTRKGPACSLFLHQRSGPRGAAQGAPLCLAQLPQDAPARPDFDRRGSDRDGPTTRGSECVAPRASPPHDAPHLRPQGVPKTVTTPQHVPMARRGRMPVGVHVWYVRSPSSHGYRGSLRAQDVWALPFTV